MLKKQRTDKVPFILHICGLVDTNICDGCNTEIEDFKHLLWECTFSANIWKETERQIKEKYKLNTELKKHNIMLGVNPEVNKNHAAINTIIRRRRSSVGSALAYGSKGRRFKPR